MALIRIHADGTFETAQVEAVAATGVELKAAIKKHQKDKTITNKIEGLKGTRDGLRVARDRIKGSKVSVAAKAKSLASYATRINKLNDAIKTLTSKLSSGKYASLAIIEKRIKTATERYAKMSGGAAPATRTPRAPKDHGAAFDRGAKKIAGTISRGIRSELRDHGKTALVPVSNRPGAKAPVAKPSSKKADTATKHATKPSRGAIGNTLSEIRAIKARIATGELKGAKLIRAREELEKQREALRGLRAGKSPANQRAIVKPGTAKHMGGAKKIVGKESGMGDAKVSARIAKLKALLKQQREQFRGIAEKGPRKATLARQINDTKAKLAALQPSKGPSTSKAKQQNLTASLKRKDNMVKARQGR